MKHVYEYRVKLVKETTVSYGHAADIKSSTDIVYYMKNFIADSDREMCAILLLDTKNRVNGIHMVSIGSLNAAIVHPREVFKAAILANSAAIAIGHNHPSGESTPSREDCEITKRLTEAGDILGIRVLDHVVIGQNDYYSFADRGMMR